MQSHDKVKDQYCTDWPKLCHEETLVQPEPQFRFFSPNISSSPKSTEVEFLVFQKLNCYFELFFSSFREKITGQVATLQVLSEVRKYWIKKYITTPEEQQRKRPKITKDITRFLIYLPGKWNHLIHLAQKSLEENTVLSCGIWQSHERH